MHHVTVAAGSAADESTISDLKQLPEDAWINLAVRDNRLLPITGGTRLRAGDEIVVLADPDRADDD